MWDEHSLDQTTSLSVLQADWCLRLPGRAEASRSAGRCRGERLRRIGWLLITAVLLSMLKHAGSRWAGSLWLSEREGGCYGQESEGERATETPARGGGRTAEKHHSGLKGLLPRLCESCLRAHTEKLIRALSRQRKHATERLATEVSVNETE